MLNISYAKSKNAPDKKIAIMQPYFFPYIGYVSLIKHTDRFILLDTVQFIYHGWIERNRILKPQNGWQYVKVPLKPHSRDTLICDIQIQNEHKWKNKILAQLQHYKKQAPYYKHVIGLCEDLFSHEFNDIVSLNANALRIVLEYLNVEKQIEVFSEMNLTIEPPKAPDEWALNICEAVGNVKEYWNPIGGKTFFDRNKYDKKGIKLRFNEAVLTPYNQRRPVFEPGLSILDVLMFNSIENVNKMLDEFTLI